MKVTVNQDNTIQLEEVFNHIVLKTKDGEEMAICMRDSGFEFNYQGGLYSAKEGFVSPLKNTSDILDVLSDENETIKSE